ncbi:hypothetical protein ACFWPK_33185 [Nocardia sp. NPDC058519]|uniref:hypothetical protein n=1 Tax=Nocardia sp. NPDC058519 TaxID=3346535 RepID=UPI003660DDCA
MKRRLFTDGYRSAVVDTDPTGRIVIDFKADPKSDAIRLSLSTSSAEGLALDLVDAVKEVLDRG